MFYNLNGALVAAPHLGAGTGFEKHGFNLYPVGVETWAGFVFVHLTPSEAKPLTTHRLFSGPSCWNSRGQLCSRNK